MQRGLAGSSNVYKLPQLSLSLSPRLAGTQKRRQTWSGVAAVWRKPTDKTAPELLPLWLVPLLLRMCATALGEAAWIVRESGWGPGAGYLIGF